MRPPLHMPLPAMMIAPAARSDRVKGAAHSQPHPQLYLVHGELDKMQALQARIKDVHGWEAQIPVEGQVIQL